MSEPCLFDSQYSKSGSSILEICSGNLGHLNLKQVALLETNLSKLFKNLSRLKESLKTVKNSSQNQQNLKRNSEFLPLHKENLKTQLEESIKLTSECTNDLFDLSLLVPSAPWVSLTSHA